jgi:N-acetylglucosamine-6-phosphate deacetylase
MPTITDAAHVGPVPALAARLSGRRRQVAFRAALTLAFTGVQAWAILLVRQVELGSGTRVALSAALAAAILTVLDAWRDVWALARTAPAVRGRPGPRHRPAR